MNANGLLIAIGLGILASPGPLVNAQEADGGAELLSLCAEIRCYPPGPITIVLDDRTVAELGGSEYPFPMVHDNVVYLFPGASFYIAAELVDGTLTNMRVIDKPEVLENVLALRMWQEPDKADTFLSIVNYFPEVLKYRAGMMPAEEIELRATSSCPVLGGGVSVYEHWPQALFQLVLVDFHVIDVENGTLTCE